MGRMRSLLLSRAIWTGVLGAGCRFEGSSEVDTEATEDGTGETNTSSTTTQTSGSDGTVSGSETQGSSDSGSASESATAGSGSSGDTQSTTEDASEGTGSNTSSTSDGSSGEADTGGSLDDLLRLDHVQVKGTHNSYHVKPPVVFDASHDYTHSTLTEQLRDHGIRAFELDLHLEADGFHVYHIVAIDRQTTCETLVECLGEIKTWSDANPRALPIMVWFEIKDDAGGMAIDDLEPVDEILRATFSPDQLYTPDDFRGAYETPRDRLEAEGWPTLREVRGKVLFIVLDTDPIAESYSSGYTTTNGKAMFVRAPVEHFEASWAVFAKNDDPTASDVIEQAHAAQLVIASNTCAANQSDEACTSELAAGMANGVHMLKDDFEAPVDGRAYYLDFPDGNPARCNEVTAPPECTSVALEDL